MSVLFHTGVVGILAGVMIAVQTRNTTVPLDVTFALEEAEGGDQDFGNAEIEIELPVENANPVAEMSASVELPLTIVPTSEIPMSLLAGFASTKTESSGGAKRGSNASEGKAGTKSGPGESDNASHGNVTFFGHKVRADSVAFVIDASKSMAGLRFQRARTELLSALSKLQSDQRFFVVFYTDQTYPMFFPENTIELIQANSRNQDRVFSWIAKSQVQGGTEPQNAMAMALRLQPDVVFFLSDGDIPFQTQGIVRSQNRRSAVHTITFGSDVGAKIMRQIASNNGGEYRFIPDGF